MNNNINPDGFANGKDEKKDEKMLDLYKKIA
jgi:hypothetical protein